MPLRYSTRALHQSRSTWPRTLRVVLVAECWTYTLAMTSDYYLNSAATLRHSRPLLAPCGSLPYQWDGPIRYRFSTTTSRTSYSRKFPIGQYRILTMFQSKAQPRVTKTRTATMRRYQKTTVFGASFGNTSKTSTESFSA